MHSVHKPWESFHWSYWGFGFYTIIVGRDWTNSMLDNLHYSSEISAIPCTYIRVYKVFGLFVMYVLCICNVSVIITSMKLIMAENGRNKRKLSNELDCLEKRKMSIFALRITKEAKPLLLHPFYCTDHPQGDLDACSPIMKLIFSIFSPSSTPTAQSSQQLHWLQNF